MKINNEIKNEIMNKLKNGMKQNDIIDEYKISKSTIYRM